MNSAQRTRCFLLVVVMLVMVGVFVFCRRDPPQTTARVNQQLEEKPLTLRKNLALNVGDRTAGTNQQFVPIPDNAVPIQWEDSRATPALPSFSPIAPERQRHALEHHRQQAIAPRRAVQQRPPPDPTYHRIVDGETLRDIAARYLGSPDRFMELFYANRALLPHPDVLPLGAKIVIPAASQTVGPVGPVAPDAPDAFPPLQFSPIPPPTTPRRSPDGPPSPVPNDSPWQSRSSEPR